MGRRVAGTEAPVRVPRENRRKVTAAYVAQPPGKRAGFHPVKGAAHVVSKHGEPPPVVGVFVFEPNEHGIGSSFFEPSERFELGLLELLFAGKPNLGRPLDREGFFEERDGLTYVHAVAMQTPVYAWVNEHFPGAKWGGLPRWDLAFAVQGPKVVAIVAGVVPTLPPLPAGEAGGS